MATTTTYFGQLRANPLADPDNNLKLGATCGEPDTVSQDFFSGAKTGTDTVDSVVIDGVTYGLEGNTVTSLLWLEEIQSLLYTTGANTEINVWARASYSGGVLKFKHIGQRTVSALVLSSGSTATTRSAATTLDLVA